MNPVFSIYTKYFIVPYGRLELSLITANCYPENQRSKSLLLRQGFVSEATLHQAELTYDGRVLDHECFYLPKR